MNYRDLQNISNLSQEILIEGANEEHNVLNRWPYTSPYLQESTELDESGKNDARIRGNIKSFGSNYTPPRDWDQSANRGQGAVLNAKQKEKQRRKGLRQEEYKESFNIFVNSMIAEGVSMERYTWEEIQNVFDDLFEAEVANRNPDEYERKEKKGQSREQQLKGRVMGRMSQMDPDKKAAMLKQMRAVGLDV